MRKLTDTGGIVETSLGFVIVFDLDGVIVDSNWAHRQAISTLCSRYGIVIPDEHLKARVFGRRNDEWIRDVFGGDLKPTDVARLDDEKEALFREIYAPHVAPLRGLPDFLESLEAKGVPMALATSAPTRNVDFIFEATGLKGYFSVVLDAAAVSAGKPDPEIYLRAAKELDVTPAFCIIFEDSLIGIEAARRAGGKIVAVTTTHAAEELSAADLVVEDFAGLTVDRLRRLMERGTKTDPKRIQAIEPAVR